MTVRPVTTEGKLLAKISDQLDELIGILRPEPSPTEPKPETGDAPAEKTAAKKAPAKKATTRKRVTGQ